MSVEDEVSNLLEVWADGSVRIQSRRTHMIVETPATGERITARIVDGDSSEPLAITLEFLGRVHYMLAPMLETGWRIVDATPAELATLQAHGLVTAPKPR